MVGSNTKIDFHPEVGLDEDNEILKKTCYWIIFKFLIDPYHKQQNSSRTDLIGGFIDRWLNRIPETLIFDKLLRDNGMGKYHVINDTFLYKDSISKNAPDILGLYYEKDDGIRYIPFVKFNNGKWYANEEIKSPFLEMKTFRENHSLVTIPINQFKDNHYYAIVESYVDKLYLLSLFSEDFLSYDIYNELFNNVEKNKQFILHDEGNQLESPQKWLDENEEIDESINDPNQYLKHKINDLGFYKLLGIYKGSTVSKYSVIVGKDDKKNDGDDEDNKKPYKPLYLSEIKTVEKRKLECLNNTVDEYEFYTEIKCRPAFIYSKKAEITVINETSEKTYIFVEGEAFVNGIRCCDNFYELEFSYEIKNATKYYYLLNVDEIENPIINQEKKLYGTGIIYKHYGEEKIFATFDIEFINDSLVSIIKNTRKYNILNVQGSAKIGDKCFTDTAVKLNFKKKDGVFCLESKEECNYSHDNLEVFLPKGNHKFLKDFDIYDPIEIIVPPSSKLFFVNKTKTWIIVKVEGIVKINGYDVNEGISKLKFGVENKHKYLKEPIEVEEDDERESNNDTYYLCNGLNYPVRYEKKKYDILSIDDDTLIIKNSRHDLNTENFKNFEKIPIYIDSYQESKFKIRNVPFNVNLVGNSTIEVIENGKTTLIHVEGQVYINNHCLKSGDYKLVFDVFDRNSEKDEIIFSKGIIPDEEINQDELIEELRKITESFD